MTIFIICIILGAVILLFYLKQNEKFRRKKSFKGPYFIPEDVKENCLEGETHQNKNQNAEDKNDICSQGKPVHIKDEKSDKCKNTGNQSSEGLLCFQEKGKGEIEMKEIHDYEFVKVKDYIEDVFVELKYATEDNFTKQIIYDFNDAWLRYGTVKKLLKVQKKLKENELSLKIWDAFRPIDAQFKLWEVYPDPDFVADPTTGFSNHSRGNTVDITLTNPEGNELEMPTGFDDFSEKAGRKYEGISKEARENALLMERIMANEGFIPYENEWWHFSDSVEYSVEKEFIPV